MPGRHVHCKSWPIRDRGCMRPRGCNTHHWLSGLVDASKGQESAAHIRPHKFVACVHKAQGLSSLKRLFASRDGL